LKHLLNFAAVAIFVALGLIFAPAAHADRAAADHCAAALPPASQSLYEQSLPEVLGGEAIRDALTANARAMVMSGSLSRAAARPAAEAAAPCLAQAR
jgi:hypothetical protein